MSVKQQFIDANLNRFKAAIEAPEAKEVGIGNYLRKMGYRISRAGNTTHFAKGRAIISINGKNKASITLLKPC